LHIAKKAKIPLALCKHTLQKKLVKRVTKIRTNSTNINAVLTLSKSTPFHLYRTNDVGLREKKAEKCPALMIR